MRRRTIVQAGLLAGVGLALFVGPERPAEAGPFCFDDAQCTFVKPMLLFALDYSTAMNATYDMQRTRWEAVVEWRVTLASK